MTSEREAELTKRQHDAAAAIHAQANVLGSTADPKLAREARDQIFEATERAVEAVDVQARIADRKEAPVC